MFVFCSANKTVDIKQIQKSFFPDESEKSSIPEFIRSQPINSISYSTTTKDNNSLWKKILVSLGIIIIILLFIIGKLIYKDKKNYFYEERKKVIEDEADKVICNLLFSYIGVGNHSLSMKENNPQITAAIAVKQSSFISYFQDFIEKFFDIEEELQELQQNIKVISSSSKSEIIKNVSEKVTYKLQEFYWPLDQKKIVLNFTNEICKNPILAKETEKFSKNNIMQLLIPNRSLLLEKESIEDLLPLASFRNSIDNLLLARSIANKFTWHCPHQKAEFKKGTNESIIFLFFIQSLLNIDKKSANLILSIRG